MSEWKEFRLSKLCKIGSSKRIFSSEYVVSGIPFFRSKEIIEKAFGDSISESLFISEERFQDIDKKFGSPNEGDILISSVGARSGIPYRVKKEDGKFYFKDGNLIWLKEFSEDFNSFFLLYWMKSNIGQESLQSIMIGSAQPALTIDGISNLFINIPDRRTQEEITDVLYCLDRKIENLRRQNETLETIAQTLFKHWFIDFEFPDADGKPYKSSGGEMWRSAIGNIPEGWKVEKFGEYIDIQHGFNFKSEDFVDEGDIVVRMGNFLTNGGLDFNVDKTKYFKGKVDKKFILNSGDLVVVMSDVTQNGLILGNSGIIPSNNQKYLLNQRVGKVSINQVLNKTFVYYLMMTKRYKHWIKNSANSTTVLNTSPSRIGEFDFFLPSNIHLLNRFETSLHSLLKKKETNIFQIQTLTKTREALLPKLMSGQLRIEE